MTKFICPLVKSIVHCISIRRIFSFSIILIALFTLSGCELGGMLTPRGPIADTQLKLLGFATGLMLLVVVPVIFLAIYFAWRYRANGRGKYAPEWSHSTKLEIVWWGIPCIIIGILATVTWFTTHSLDPYKPLASTKKPLTIQTIALDWKWLFIYPDYGIATINYIEVPVNRPIHFEVSSAAPMNSFIIPQLGGQIYAMTGMKTQLNLLANKPGVYRGFSANYTGAGFAEMQFYAKATSEAGFSRWVRTVKRSSQRLTWQTFWKKWVKPSEKVKPIYFGRVDKHLFTDVINHYKIPNYQPRMRKLSRLPINHAQQAGKS